MRSTDDVERALADAHRCEWAQVLSTTACAVRDLDLAEECVQEAYAEALVAWRRGDVPDNPAAWLITAARRRGFDALRRRGTLRSKIPLLVSSVDEPGGGEVPEALDGGDVSVPDDRLRLIFMCCHPALALEAQVALTLRLVCGVPTADIARVLLVSGTAMSTRLTRAKKKIALARIPVRVPAPWELPERVDAVLGVVYLLFTVGHAAPSGDALQRPELVDQSLRLARLLVDLMPDEAEVRGLLALLLAIDARRSTRTDADGRPLRLEEQDRAGWDRAAIAEAHDLVDRALRVQPRGRYLLQAAIASRHAEAPSYEETEWAQILHLYDELSSVWPSPVVALNRAVALSMVAGPEPALAVVEDLECRDDLHGYRYLPAVKADLLRRLGRLDEARRADQRALELAGNESERRLLAARVDQHEPEGSPSGVS